MYQGGEGPSQEDLNTQKARAESLNNFAKKHINQVSRHLDIGCSAGELLMSFQNAFNNQSIGVEPGKAYREYAQSQRLKVYYSLNELQQTEEATFDLISMSHVLEHIPDPVEYLQNLREEILTPDGWMLIEVPNLYAHDSFEIAHLLSFSPHTFEQTLEQAGFKVVKLIKHGWPRSQIIPLYLTALARPSKKQKSTKIEPERMVSIKRKLGMLRRRILTRLMLKRAWIPKT
jgi:2-polyprenyl-3-methyl-5-hydroxy-6-metoxy-1,4-benzoquinol methylase